MASGAEVRPAEANPARSARHDGDHDDARGHRDGREPCHRPPARRQACADPLHAAFPYAMGPAGALNSNVPDMAKWPRLRFRRWSVSAARSLVSEGNLDVNPDAAQSALGERLSYAVGWCVLATPHGRVIWHKAAPTASAPMSLPARCQDRNRHPDEYRRARSRGFAGTMVLRPGARQSPVDNVATAPPPIASSAANRRARRARTS